MTSSLDIILQHIKTNHSNVTYKKSNKSYWDPLSQTIFHNPNKNYAEVTLLHELGHAINQDKQYKYDTDLLKMELQAWQQANKISKKLAIDIDKNYIEDCMDSYRNWLHARSKCPNCSQNSIQNSELKYVCLNCGCTWQTSRERFCRTYRKKIAPREISKS